MVRMAEDLIDWIDSLGNEPVHLVGHDWGGIIAYAAGALAPGRFHSLTTMAVPHIAHMTEGIRRVPIQMLKSWYMGFFQVRGVSDWVLQRNDWAFIKRLWDVWGPAGVTIPISIGVSSEHRLYRDRIKKDMAWARRFGAWSVEPRKGAARLQPVRKVEATLR